MARCSLGPKKLRRYSRVLGVNFVRGFVRGNTNHRVDLYDENDNCISVYPNKWKKSLDVITTSFHPDVSKEAFEVLSQFVAGIKR